MTKSVWKANLAQSLVHSLPMGAHPIHADYSANGDICIWLMVDDRAPRVDFAFLVSGTGWSIPEWVRPDHHIASMVNRENGNVWHVFNLGYLQNMTTASQRDYQLLAEDRQLRVSEADQGGGHD